MRSTLQEELQDKPKGADVRSDPNPGGEDTDNRTLDSCLQDCQHEDATHQQDIEESMRNRLQEETTRQEEKLQDKPMGANMHSDPDPGCEDFDNHILYLRLQDLKHEDETHHQDAEAIMNYFLKQVGEDPLPTPSNDTNPETGRANKRSRFEPNRTDDHTPPEPTIATEPSPHRAHPSTAVPQDRLRGHTIQKNGD